MTAMHDLRIRAAVRSLEAATTALIGFADALPESLTTERLPGGWTPAGHVWHVALTNDVFSGVIKGDGPLRAVSGTSDFTDAQWNFNVPPTVAAPGILIPPADAQRVTAAKRLRESVARLRPLVESLAPDQGTLCVQLPWNTISLYQMTEWAAGHTLRHLSQVGRELHLSALRVPVAV